MPEIARESALFRPEAPIRIEVMAAGASAFALLDDDAARATPYQRGNWIAAWLGATGRQNDFRLLRLIAPGGEWRLPVVIDRKFGAALADLPGEAHANFHAAIRLGAPALSATDARRALIEAGRQAGIDGFALQNVPRLWQGEPALPDGFSRSLAPDPAYLLDFAVDGPALLAHLETGDARKRRRQKVRKLAELGELSCRWVAPGAAAGAALATFFGWKAEWFRERGLPDPFAEPGVAAAFEAMAAEGGALRLYGLFTGDDLRALIGGSVHAGHFSGMFLGHAPDPDSARHSPGDLLLSDLVVELAGDGYAGFDLGAGEATYKARYCPQHLPLDDATLAVTARGAAALSLLRLLRAAKRFAKGRPALLGALQRVRTLVTR